MALLQHYLFAGKLCTSSSRESKLLQPLWPIINSSFIYKKKSYPEQPAELHFITGTV